MIGHQGWLSFIGSKEEFLRWGTLTSPAYKAVRLELGTDPILAGSFLDILDVGRGLECTDERDTVYAFLGPPAAFKQRRLDVAPYQCHPRNLCNQMPTLANPAYEENTTTLDVCLRLAYVLIKEWGIGLGILNYVSPDKETTQTVILLYSGWSHRARTVQSIRRR